MQQISANQFHHNPALPCFSYLLIPSLLLHPVMEDSCVCFGIRSLSSFFCSAAAGYVRLLPVRVVRRLTLHFLPPVYSKRRLRSPRVPSSARLGSARGLVGGMDTKNSTDGRVEGVRGERGRAAPVNPAVAKTLGSERG